MTAHVPSGRGRDASGVPYDETIARLTRERDDAVRAAETLSELQGQDQSTALRLLPVLEAARRLRVSHTTACDERPTCVCGLNNLRDAITAYDRATR